MQAGLLGQSVTATATGPTTPFRYTPPTHGSANGPSPNAGSVCPGLIVSLKSGTQTTYNVEVTGDDLDQQGYNPLTGNWAPMTGMQGLNAALAQSLGAAVTATRLNVLTLASGGAVTFQMVTVV